MNRRDTLKALLAAATTGGIASNLRAMDATERDKFGGWTGKKFKSTGFFRLEKDERWWLVTPEGNAFLSFGINHLHPGLWRLPHNRDAWKEIFGIENLQDASQFKPALREWFLATCKDFGINTVGVHCDLTVANTPAPAMPYMQPFRTVEIPHWHPVIPDERFVDIFAPEHEQHCDKLAQEIVAPLRSDPYLLGYSMTDCPLFTEEDCRERTDVIGGKRRPTRSIGWPRRLRNLGPSAPGKQAYVNLMKKLYRGDISGFNETYSTSFDSFDALAAAENWRLDSDLSNASETHDNVEFLQACVARYYECARDAIRRYDTNHLFVGDKLNANTDSVDTVVRTTSRFTDVIFYQMYAKYEVQKPGLDRWSKRIDKPIINGDSAFTMVRQADEMPNPFGPIANSMEERIEWTVEFFHKAFARPEFIGWHYCGLIDATLKNPWSTRRQHTGLVGTKGVRYDNLQNAIKACADQMYHIATHG